MSDAGTEDCFNAELRFDVLRHPPSSLMTNIKEITMLSSFVKTVFSDPLNYEPLVQSARFQLEDGDAIPRTSTTMEYELGGGFTQRRRDFMLSLMRSWFQLPPIKIPLNR